MTAAVQAIQSRAASIVRSWRAAAEVILAAVLFATASYLIFADLGASSLHDGDEALYADIAREMVTARSPLTPLYWGAPFLHKPPLPYWLMAASASAIGGSREFAARLPSAAFGVALLVLVYLTARHLAGVAMAFVATAVLAVNHQFLFEHVARSASFDAITATLMFAALVAGLRGSASAGWRCVAAGLLGALGLVKAPMTVFPAGALLAHQWGVDRRGAVKLLCWLAGGVLLVAGPWHLYQTVVQGRPFVATYIGYEMIGRLGGATLRAPGNHAVSHLSAAWASFVPWSPLLAVAVAATLVHARSSTGDRDAWARTLALYAASLAIFFCFVSAKYPWYIVPAYPAVVVVGAVAARRCWDSRQRRALPVALALACASLVVVDTDQGYAPAARASVLWPTLARFYFWHPRLEPAVWLMAGAVILATAVLVVTDSPSRRNLALAGWTSALLMLAFNLRSVLGVPQINEKAIHRLASTLEERGIRRVLAVGFRHEPQYFGRQEPVSSYYLLGIRGARVIDCGATLDCLRPLDDDDRTAVAIETEGPVGASQYPELAARRTVPVEIWVVRPGHGYERLE